MNTVRDHAHVKAVAVRLGIGYDDALALVRSQVGDPAAVAAVKEIDALTAAERERAKAKNADMCGRVGLDEAEADELIITLAADPELETWLLRRVNLTRAHGIVPAHNTHPENE